MFDRLVSLIGIDNLNKIKSKNIIVFGLGGVGGHLTEALVRSGIEHITIVDGDTVDETNLNRQIIALHSTIGKTKTEIMQERMKDINPLVQVNTINKFLQPEDIETLELKEYDYIVDCIDDVKVKVALAKYAVFNNLKLIMSTGTAKKLHPEHLSMTTLDKTSNDPLARKLRESLKDIDKSKITVLASSEVPIKNESKTLGSTAFVPSSGGLLIASFIINDIIDQKL